MEQTTSSNGGPAAPPPVAHPDLDRWIAYHAGDLAGDQETELQGHLVACRDCTTLVLDLDAFTAPASARAATSDIEMVAAWRALRPRLATRRLAVSRRWGVPATLAASFMIGALGLGLWTATRETRELRQEVAELSRPQANAPVHDLFPGAVERGGRSAGSELKVPAGSTTFTLILNLVELPDHAAYRVEIEDTEGRPALEIPNLEMDSLGLITLGLARQTLPAGNYRIRLLGINDASDSTQPVPVAIYPLEIIYL